MVQLNHLYNPNYLNTLLNCTDWIIIIKGELNEVKQCFSWKAEMLPCQAWCWCTEERQSNAKSGEAHERRKARKKLLEGLNTPQISLETPVIQEIPVRAESPESSSSSQSGTSRSGYNEVIEECKLLLAQNVNGCQCPFYSIQNG